MRNIHASKRVPGSKRSALANARSQAVWTRSSARSRERHKRDGEPAEVRQESDKLVLDGRAAHATENLHGIKVGVIRFDPMKRRSAPLQARLRHLPEARMNDMAISPLGAFASRLLAAVLVVSAAPMVERATGFGVIGSHLAHAGDDGDDGGDDDGDDGGGGGGFSDRSGGDDVRRGGRALGPRFLRDLRDRFRPRGSGRRAVAAVPLPTRVPTRSSPQG